MDDDELKFESSEENVYNDNVREELVEDDEITPEEEAFMKGYNDEDRHCAQCGVMISDEEVLEREVDGNSHKFCSEDCATKFENH